jgi:hypothetical protein
MPLRSIVIDLSHGNGGTGSMGFQGGCEESMTQPSLLRQHTTGIFAQRPSLRQFVYEGSPHLKDGVGEAELEDPSCDRSESCFLPQIDLTPALIAPLFSKTCRVFGCFVEKRTEVFVPRISRYQVFFSPGAIRWVRRIQGN